MSHRFEGRSVEEALQSAAEALGVERWQLTYHVLLEKRGFLGGVKRVVLEADINTAAAPPANTAAPAPSAPAPAAGAEGYIYYLQAGAFREMSDAENTRAKLALLGFEAAITDRTTDGGVLHRVRVGPYTGPEAMNKARAKLLDSGIDVAIVRNQR